MNFRQIVHFPRFRHKNCETDRVLVDRPPASEMRIMYHVLRLTTVAALVGLTLVASRCLYSATLEEAGLDVWAWPRLQRILLAEEERQEFLRQGFADLDRRRKAKIWVCRELIAGRVTLEDAVTRYLDLTVASEQVRRDAGAKYAGCDEQESVRRWVIDFTCDLLRDQPARASAVRRHLLTEATTLQQAEKSI
jgi:hypothetical protein